MYCRKCQYDLKGLPEHRCPECGTAFDPTDCSTYLTRQPDPTERKMTIAAIVILGALVLGVFGMIYYAVVYLNL